MRIAPEEGVVSSTVAMLCPGGVSPAPGGSRRVTRTESSAGLAVAAAAGGGGGPRPSTTHSTARSGNQGLPPWFVLNASQQGSGNAKMLNLACHCCCMIGHAVMLPVATAQKLLQCDESRQS